MTTWREAEPDDRVAIGIGGHALAGLRFLLFAMLTYGGLGIHMLVRLVERPVAGAGRPVSSLITRAVCRATFPLLGIGFRARGVPMRSPGAVVANHASWLDIFALNACQSITFVAKAEVAGWPLVGWLARATGTVFIVRDPRRAREQQEIFEERLGRNDRLLFFPEGTSTDGRRVVPFKSSLFGAFYSPALAPDLQIQPVAVTYRSPPGRGPRFYGWWGDMTFGSHLLKVLAQGRQGAVEVAYLEPVAVSAFASRKELAQHCERVIRDELRRSLGAGYCGEARDEGDRSAP